MTGRLTAPKRLMRRLPGAAARSISRGRCSSAVPTPAQLRAAVPHIAHEMVALRQAKEFLPLRVSWIAWYPLARNAATFLELVQGSAGDIRAREFFDPGTAEWKRWREGQAAAV